MRYFPALAALLLAGCASTYPIPESGTDFSLDRCPPFMNCVSSESSLFIYNVAPIQLTEPLDKASWADIEKIAAKLPGASINESRYGYIYMTCYSEVIKFPDYLEILINEDGSKLAVRSQSQFGLFDFNVNRQRVELLREMLVDQGIAELSPVE